MRKFTFILVLLFIGIQTKATHFVGYDLSITNISGGDTYLVKFTIYRENSSTSNPMPTIMNFETFVNGSNVNANINFSTPRVSIYNATYNPADCPPYNANLFLQVGVFEYTLTAAQALSLNNQNGYYFSATSCCRNAGSVNVVGSESIGMNFTLDFSPLSISSATRYNSSPRLTKSPLTFFCIGKPYSINWQGVDPDGDSLVFSLLRPTDGVSNIKPFGNAIYASGYNFNYNIMDGVPDITINPQTGIINFIPTKIGDYLIGIKVDEYRKIAGVPTKIGTIYREFQIETVICGEAPPEITSSSASNSIIVDTVRNDFDSTFTYIRDFIVTDTPNDSVYLRFQQTNADSNFNSKIQWGSPNLLVSGPNIQQHILRGKRTVTGRVKIELDSTMARNEPYRFKLLASDLTCPVPFIDTVEVYLYVKANNCALTIKNYTIYGCDSALANNGKWYKTQGLFSDTITNSNGCKRVNNYNVNLNKNILWYYLSSCDSVKGLSNNYYFTSGIYIDTVKSNSCDTIRIFEVNVKKSAPNQAIIGDTTVTPLTTLMYFITPQSGNTTIWDIKNGVIKSSADFYAMVEWDSLDNGILTATEITPNGCETTNRLFVDISFSGINVEKSNFNIYPNPSADKIWIQYLGLDNNLLAELFDVQGNKIKEIPLQKTTEVSIAELAIGVYYLRIEGEVFKVLKY